MKKLILTITLAAFAIALQAGEGECPKAKAACAKDKAACSAKADKAQCPSKAAKASCPATGGCAKGTQVKKSVPSPKAAGELAATSAQ